MKIRIIIIAFLLAAASTFAQRKPSTKAKKEVEDYKMFAYGATTNTNSGLFGGFVVRHSKTVSSHKGLPINRYIAIEAINIRHDKERPFSTGTGSRLTVGKRNYLFSIRPQYGRELLFFKKNADDGIGLSLILAAGPSIGLEKPYYIKYDKGGRNSTVETVQYNPNIHTEVRNIQGAAPIWQGLLKDAKVNPGVHAKIAANIDMNTFGNNLTGFELGLTAEYFTSKPEIMASTQTDNYRFFTSGYLTMYFGNKKKK